MHACMCVLMYIARHICMHACVYVHNCAHVCIYVCIFVCMFEHMQVSMCMYACACMCLYELFGTLSMAHFKVPLKALHSCLVLGPSCAVPYIEKRTYANVC